MVSNIEYTPFKLIAIFLSIAVLFQCCVVYDKKPVTIEEAINKNHKKQKRIKIEIRYGRILILDSLYYKDNELFGLQRKPKKKEKDQISIPEYNIYNRTITYTDSVTVKKKVEIKIDENRILLIRLQNRAKSRTASVFTVLGPILVIYISWAAQWGFGLGF